MLRKFAAVILSVALLSPAWLGLTGLTLPLALVPLLWISAEAGATRRAWWGAFGWALLTFALWNMATVWWIWNATPVGPVAATIASSFLNMVAFMLFHTVSKKGPKAVAYTLLVAGWIATEYWYTVGNFSWPWLILGNGFSHDVWAVQWYEYTGVFGGSLWVLLCNILFFEALRARRTGRWAAAFGVLLLPLFISLGIWWSWEQPDRGVAKISIVQPNVAVYEKFDDDPAWQERNIVDLLEQVPADAQFILLPETSVPRYYWEPALSEFGFSSDTGAFRQKPTDAGAFWRALTDTLRRDHPGALLVAGAQTCRYYPAGAQTRTARRDRGGNGYYDVFNTAVGLDSAGRTRLHHKGRLVIGVESTPTRLFDLLQFLEIDLGGTVGQLGKGQHGTAFAHGDVRIGPAICYEGLYGDFYGDFVRRGAQVMGIISNDAWWGDTPGYTHLFSISRLRAIEHRRAVARAANTGRSGFISARGDVGQTLSWARRGVITADVPLDTRLTFYTRYGDYVARIAEYLMLLGVLYYVAYRFRKRNHLVK